MDRVSPPVKRISGHFLAVQWLGFGASTEMMWVCPDQGTKMPQLAAEKKKRKKMPCRGKAMSPQGEEQGWAVDEKGSSQMIPQKGLETFPSGGVS